MSGRFGAFVYYWAYGRQCWHRLVLPKDPRSPAQQRSRAAFRAATKAWSKNVPLTDAQRNAWGAEAAKLKSRPRLAQSGPLTAQQSFVGCNSVKPRWGQPLLVEPPARKPKTTEVWPAGSNAAPLILQSSEVGQPFLGTEPPGATPPPSRYPGLHRVATKAPHRCLPAQMPCRQEVTKPSSGRFHTASVAPPYQCRCQARSSRLAASIALPRATPTPPQFRPHASFRHLWRGG